MSLRGKSIFVGSISFFVFALLRCFVPLRNIGFFAAACTVFVIAAVLFYIISGSLKPEWSDKNMVCITGWSAYYLDDIILY